MSSKTRVEEWNDEYDFKNFEESDIFDFVKIDENDVYFENSINRKSHTESTSSDEYFDAISQHSELSGDVEVDSDVDHNAEIDSNVEVDHNAEIDYKLDSNAENTENKNDPFDEFQDMFQKRLEQSSQETSVAAESQTAPLNTDDVFVHKYTLWDSVATNKTVVDSNITNLSNFNNMSGYSVVQNLCHMVTRNCTEKVRELIKSGININDFLSFNFIPPLSTLLIKAIENNNIDILRLLLQAGMKPNFAPNGNLNPLVYAIKLENIAAINELLIHGADADKADMVTRKKPLLFAAEKQLWTVVYKLLYYKADINAVDDQANTVLMLAVKNNHHDLVRYLISLKANLDIANNDGDTALIIASRERYNVIIEMLLRQKIHVDWQNKKGETALSISAEKLNCSAIKMLLDYGVCLNTVDDLSRTPITIAKNYQNREILTLFENALLSLQDCKKTIKFSQSTYGLARSEMYNMQQTQYQSTGKVIKVRGKRL